MGSAADAERDIIPCRRIPSNAKVRQLTAGATLSTSRYVSTAEETWQLGILNPKQLQGGEDSHI
jgi:hypothetical protein